MEDVDLTFSSFITSIFLSECLFVTLSMWQPIIVRCLANLIPFGGKTIIIHMNYLSSSGGQSSGSSSKCHTAPYARVPATGERLCFSSCCPSGIAFLLTRMTEHSSTLDVLDSFAGSAGQNSKQFMSEPHSEMIWAFYWSQLYKHQVNSLLLCCMCGTLKQFAALFKTVFLPGQASSLLPSRR